MKNGAKIVKKTNINKLNYKIMKKVYLVDILQEDGKYLKTTELAFTSKAAAKRYANDCDFKTDIKEVEILSLADF